VHEQIQRLLDARDQEAFSRLLIDSVCSMPADDFRRVREKLIRKFVDDQQRRAVSSRSDDVKAAMKTEDDVTQSVEDAANDDDASRPALSLKIVNVRSCSVDEKDGPWSPSRSGAGDWPPVKREPSPDPASCHGEHLVDDVATPTNYITIAPIETTPDAAISDEETPIIESRDDDQAQRQHVDVTDVLPASAARHRESGQVYSEKMKQQQQTTAMYGHYTGQSVLAGIPG